MRLLVIVAVLLMGFAIPTDADAGIFSRWRARRAAIRGRVVRVQRAPVRRIVRSAPVRSYYRGGCASCEQ